MIGCWGCIFNFCEDKGQDCTHIQLFPRPQSLDVLRLPHQRNYILLYTVPHRSVVTTTASYHHDSNSSSSCSCCCSVLLDFARCGSSDMCQCDGTIPAQDGFRLQVQRHCHRAQFTATHCRRHGREPARSRGRQWNGEQIGAERSG